MNLVTFFFLVAVVCVGIVLGWLHWTFLLLWIAAISAFGSYLAHLQDIDKD